MTKPRQFEDEALPKERRAPPPGARRSCLRQVLRSPAAWFFVLSLVTSWYVHALPHTPSTWRSGCGSVVTAALLWVRRAVAPAARSGAMPRGVVS